MSEESKKCVLVAPGHNLPKGFDPKTTDVTDAVKIEALKRGVLQLGHCDCEKYQRQLIKYRWMGAKPCPHLVVTHSKELIDAVSRGDIKAVNVREFDYEGGVLVWVVQFREHYWLRKIPNPLLLDDELTLGDLDDDLVVWYPPLDLSLELRKLKLNRTTAVQRLISRIESRCWYYRSMISLRYKKSIQRLIQFLKKHIKTEEPSLGLSGYLNRECLKPFCRGECSFQIEANSACLFLAEESN
jgi:predicted nucleic acid-binding Zn finger protein